MFKLDKDSQPPERVALMKHIRGLKVGTCHVRLGWVGLEGQPQGFQVKR